MLTKKDFQGLAQAIRDVYLSDRAEDEFESAYHAGFGGAKAAITGSIADWLSTQNPNFDRERWLEYIREGK